MSDYWGVDSGRVNLNNPCHQQDGPNIIYNIMSDQEQAGKPKPFDIGYVIRTTQKHQRRSIDISISKTYGRLPEFVADEAKSKEVFMTLGILHGMRENLDNFEHQNPQYFQGK